METGSAKADAAISPSHPAVSESETLMDREREGGRGCLGEWSYCWDDDSTILSQSMCCASTSCCLGQDPLSLNSNGFFVAVWPRHPLFAPPPRPLLLPVPPQLDRTAPRLSQHWQQPWLWQRRYWQSMMRREVLRHLALQGKLACHHGFEPLPTVSGGDSPSQLTRRHVLSFGQRFLQRPMPRRGAARAGGRISR